MIYTETEYISCWTPNVTYEHTRTKTAGNKNKTWLYGVPDAINSENKSILCWTPERDQWTPIDEKCRNQEYFRKCHAVSYIVNLNDEIYRKQVYFQKVPFNTHSQS